MGAGHAHEPPPAPRRLRRLLLAVIIPLAAATLAGLVVLWPHGHPARFASGRSTVRGTATALHRQSCTAPRPVPPAPGTRQCGTVRIAMHDGPDAGRSVTVDLPEGPAAPYVQVGDRLVLSHPVNAPPGGQTPYTVIDHQRDSQLWVLVVLFAAVVIAVGRWRGLAALGGLALSLGIVFAFTLPAIAGGAPPLPVATAGAAAMILAGFYLTNAMSVETSVAVLGTLASLILTGVLATAAVAATHLSGYGTEEARELPVVLPHVDVHGLLLAGIIIASLGGLNDVTVTQAATVTELAAADPHMTRRRLYRAAARIGRAHIASTVNTIILAYAGASLPLLLLIISNAQSVGATLTSQFVSQEIVRSIAGTIGLVAAVPITTGLAALMTAGAYPDTPQTAAP